MHFRRAILSTPWPSFCRKFLQNGRQGGPKWRAFWHFFCFGHEFLKPKSDAQASNMLDLGAPKIRHFQVFCSFVSESAFEAYIFSSSFGFRAPRVRFRVKMEQVFRASGVTLRAKLCTGIAFARFCSLKTHKNTYLSACVAHEIQKSTK